MTEYVQVANPPTVCGITGCFNDAHVQINTAIGTNGRPSFKGLCDIHINRIMVLRFFKGISDEDSTNKSEETNGN